MRMGFKPGGIRFNESRIKKQIIYLNILLLIVFVVITICSNLYFRVIMEVNYKNESTRQLENVVSTVSSHYDKIENIIFQLSENTLVTLFGMQKRLADSENTYFSAKEISSQLNLVRQAISDVREIYIWFRETNIVVNTHGTMSKFVFDDTLPIENEAEFQEISGSFGFDKKISIINAKDKDSNENIWIHPSKNFVIVACVEYNTLNALLSKITTYDTGITTITWKDDQKYLIHAGKGGMIDGNESVETVRQNISSYTQKDMFGKQKYLLNEYFDEKRQMGYTSIYSGKQVAEQYAKTNLVSMGFFLVLVMIDIIVFVLLKRDWYKPVRSLIDNMGEVPADDSGQSGNEIYMISEIMSSLKTDIYSTMNEKELLKDELKDIYISLKASGFDTARDVSDLEMQSQGDASYIIICCVFENRFGIADEAFASEFEMEISQKLFCKRLLIDVETYTYLLTFTAGTAYQTILSKTIDGLEHAVKFCLIGVSNPETNISKVREIYKESHMAMLNSESDEGGGFHRITYYEDVKSQAVAYFELTLENQRVLVNLASHGSVAKTRAIFDEIVAVNMDKNYFQQKLLCNAMINILNEVAAMKNIYDDDDKRLEHEEWEKGLRSAYNLSLVYSGLKERLLSVTQYIHDNTQAMTDVILRYIDQNYHRQISLENLEEELHVSYAHISRTFKKEMGMTLVNYLQMKRLEKAKELMKNEKGIKISHVAQATGFNTVGNFIKLFKKFEGITPGEFMKKAEAIKAEQNPPQN